MAEFVRYKYQDIQSRNANLYNQFLAYWKVGNYQSALDVINNNASLNTEAFTAGAINTIGAALTYLQNNYFDNVEGALAKDLDALNLAIHHFSNQHAYNHNTQYYVNEFVLYNDLYYMCIVDSYGNFPNNTKYWVLVGLKGEQGMAGTGLNLRYTWGASTNYAKYDVVYLSGTLYVAKQANTNQDPTTATTYWELLMKVPTTSITYGVPTDPYEGQVWAKVL